MMGFSPLLCRATTAATRRGVLLRASAGAPQRHAHRGQGETRHLPAAATARFWATQQQALALRCSPRGLSTKAGEEGVDKKEEECCEGEQHNHDIKVPSIVEARAAPNFMCELSNEVLYVLAEEGYHDACEERLIRNIMTVDNIEWFDARDKLPAIRAENQKHEWVVTLPYKVGIGTGLLAGVACVPMVFHKKTAIAFNSQFVTMEVPSPQDMETVLEIGSWTWNWMEPPLGVASFVLLAMQFVRAQMQNMNIKPYTAWVKNHRARNLAQAFPEYNTDMLMEFSQTSSLRNSKGRT